MVKGIDLNEKIYLCNALNNCGFVSTFANNSTIAFSEPFCFLLDSCLLNVGIGFDTKGVGKQMIYKPSTVEDL